MIYSIILVSDIEESDSVIHIYVYIYICILICLFFNWRIITELCWFLPNINMNQPYVYIRPLPLLRFFSITIYYIKCSSLFYIVNPCCLSLLYIIVIEPRFYDSKFYIFFNFTLTPGSVSLFRSKFLKSRELYKFPDVWWYLITQNNHVMIGFCHFCQRTPLVLTVHLANSPSFRIILYLVLSYVLLLFFPFRLSQLMQFESLSPATWVPTLLDFCLFIAFTSFWGVVPSPNTKYQ